MPYISVGKENSDRRFCYVFLEVDQERGTQGLQGRTTSHVHNAMGQAE